MSKSTQPIDTRVMHDAEVLHRAMTELLRVYQFRDRDRICCHDISVTQCHALQALVEQGPLRSQALAKILLLDKSTTTRVVDALVRKHYVERKSDSSDARAVLLVATTAGRKLYQRIDQDLIRQQVELLRDFEPQARIAAAEVIQRMARAAQARFLRGISVGDCDSDDSSGACTS